ncbi:NlpC/P60 family protein [Actinomadura oligospora]|uniref:NlpC/P60 family protein n=1 Tax=Actinomadura oligospora TaxID=111804 RepID=UPI0004B039C7|nr:NlpC/P60 family protein [Actinomadura oligospora]
MCTPIPRRRATAYAAVYAAVTATASRDVAVRLVAVSTGIAVGLTAVPTSAQAAVTVGRAVHKPSPSADDVAKSKNDVRKKAEAVGRAKAQLAQADGEQERFAIAAEAAVERYNGEQVKLERSQQAFQAAQRRVADAQQRYDETQRQLASFAADAYRQNTGVNPWAAVIAGEGGPQGFMDRAGMVEVLARRRTEVIKQVEASRIVANVFRRQAAQAYRDQQTATRQAVDAKTAAQKILEQQKAVVARIGEQKKVLEQSLGTARARAADLARQRAAALEAAEAARARRAASGAGAEVGASVGSGTGAVAARAALKWLGTPYSWGGGTAGGPSYGIEQGSGIHGFDCSGLALYAWNKAGVRLDHWTGTQWTSGPHVPLGRLRPGDLVFFAKDKSDPDTIHHVGIFIGRGRMVEAPYTGASVRVSSIYRGDLIGATRPSG